MNCNARIRTGGVALICRKHTRIKKYRQWINYTDILLIVAKQQKTLFIENECDKCQKELAGKTG